jgi:hypothetical protein
MDVHDFGSPDIVVVAAPDNPALSFPLGTKRLGAQSGAILHRKGLVEKMISPFGFWEHSPEGLLWDGTPYPASLQVWLKGGPGLPRGNRQFTHWSFL